MTLLSRKADYALLILCHLHKNPEGANARAIAERFSLSRPFVANILKELCHKGFVKSHRGVKGGYVLQESARNLSVADLLEGLNEGFQFTLCTHPTGAAEVCSLEPTCPVKGPLTDIHRKIVSVLRGVRLAEIFEPVQMSAATSLLPLLLPIRTPAATAEIVPTTV